MQREIEARRAAEEARKAEQEAERQRIEDEKRAAEEEERRKEEERLAKVEAKKAKKEQMRKEGKLLTAKQKEDERRLAARRAELEAQAKARAAYFLCALTSCSPVFEAPVRGMSMTVSTCGCQMSVKCRQITTNPAIDPSLINMRQQAHQRQQQVSSANMQKYQFSVQPINHMPPGGMWSMCCSQTGMAACLQGSVAGATYVSVCVRLQ